MLQNLLCYFSWITIVFLQTSNCRRYDIEEEAQKLYSTNLKDVMERFRRTPEYLKILNDQIDLEKKNSEAIAAYTMFYHGEKLQAKVNAIFGGNETKSLRTIGQLKFKKILRRPRPRKKLKFKNKRNGDSLDNYKKFHSSLTLEERNHMKELGFEFAGRAIHAMIKNLSPGDALSLSTLLPYGGDPPGTSSTTHHHDHEVTHSSPNTEATETTHSHHTHTTDDKS